MLATSINLDNRCSPNEEYIRCGTCEGTCVKPFVICSKECKPAGCYCKSSKKFVRGPFGLCMLFKYCPNYYSNKTIHSPFSYFRPHFESEIDYLVVWFCANFLQSKIPEKFILIAKSYYNYCQKMEELMNTLISYNLMNN
ncbi:unnamed protein product [Thelazia callipaeda]|uniref:TIL domain-containing protein n=1 Tax=Thelazia callipaeda TaxID=103827 RepID=A0A0N5CZ12_THECL|nr:unnamed protein product [Thelazia callipaeda]